MASVAAVFVALALGGCDCGALPLDESGRSDGGAGAGGGVAGANGGGDASGGGGVTGGATGGGSAVVSSDGGVCPPFACAGRCGPVRDFCRGETVACGSCSGSDVCNLATNQCGPIKTSCNAGECGLIRNSCGDILNCGACADPGQECDRNTNTCVPCTGVTPADLGYQCGSVNLGCGPASTRVDAGTCPAGAVCNGALNICEPQCSPERAAILCLVAGAECGPITDGCGGMVSCGGCDADAGYSPDAGYACGARGLNNRCGTKAFDQCLAANRNCGPYTNACGAQNCGTCTAPEVCNANGRCGPPCASATCANFPGGCGVHLDAGCEVTIDCACDNGRLCTTAPPGQLGVCQPPAACTAFGATGVAGSPCSNDPSPAFPSGGGSNLACACSGSGVCVDGAHQVVGAGDAGTCCVNTAVCPAGACGMSVVNTCTGQSIACGCMGTDFCLADAGVCVAPRSCASYGAHGDAGNPCSVGASPEFPKNATENLACPCKAGGICNVADGGLTQAAPYTRGTCCFNTVACAAGECGTTHINQCTGATITCACTTPGTHCNAGTNHCDADLTCSSYSATGGTGAVCSNGGAFSNGASPATMLTCPCTGGNVCVNGTTVVAGSTTGACCLNTASCGNRCHSTSTNSCTGVVTACECNAANAFCDAPDGGEGTCVPYNTCSTYGANGNLNNVCSTSANHAFNQMPDGSGADLTCNCTGGRSCSVDAGAPNPHLATTGELGTCCANSASCGSGVGKLCNTSLTNTCTSASISCATCDSSTYCSTTSGAGTCLANLTCSTYGANGNLGNVCSTSANAAFNQMPDGGGSNLTCGCGGGRICSVDAGVPNPPHQAGSGELGTCCSNTATCPANTCASIKNTCTGATITCGCSAGYHCMGDGGCNQNRTCASYGASGAVGAACSTVPSSAFPDAPDAGNLTCGCSSAAPYTRNACVGSSATDAGLCTCVPSTPANCGDDGKSDGCGGTMTSKCGSGQVCFSNACCTSPTCSAGNAGDVCGTISACGQSVTCGCVQSYPNTSCGALDAGVCGCKPYTTDNCGGHPLGSGAQSNGCGGWVTCGN